jgi:hypothetical protein
MNGESSQTIVAGLKARHPSLADQPEKVERKVASLRRGLGYFVMGGLLLLAAVAVFLAVVLVIILPAVQADRDVGLMLVILALALPLLMGIAGVYLIFAGGNVASGEAMRAAAEDLKGVGGFAAKLIARAHRKT